MENSVHAIKMAFGVLVFSLAIGIALMLFSQARKTSQSILYSKEEEMSRVSNQEDANSNPYRIVGLETVIPTIFDYYDSKSIIYLKKGNYNQLDNASNMRVYKSKGQARYCFDIEAEKARSEEWATNKDDTRNFLKEVLFGSDNKYQSELNRIFNNTNQKFVERIGKQSQSDGTERTVIEYILIQN